MSVGGKPSLPSHTFQHTDTCKRRRCQRIVRALADGQSRSADNGRSSWRTDLQDLWSTGGRLGRRYARMTFRANVAAKSWRYSS